MNEGIAITGAIDRMFRMSSMLELNLNRLLFFNISGGRFFETTMVFLCTLFLSQLVSTPLARRYNYISNVDAAKYSKIHVANRLSSKTISEWSGCNTVFYRRQYRFFFKNFVTKKRVSSIRKRREIVEVCVGCI